MRISIDGVLLDRILPNVYWDVKKVEQITHIIDTTFFREYCASDQILA